MQFVRVIDIETACLEAPAAPASGICEIGWCDLGEDGEIVGSHSTMVNPGIQITPECSGIHHIINSDVQAMGPLDTIVDDVLFPGAILCGHNAAFEQKFLARFMPPLVRWICTYKVAMRLWPEAPNHKNQTLRYYLNLLHGAHWRRVLDRNHHAEADAVVTAAILSEAMKHLSIAEMIDISSNPILQSKIRFGKHSGAWWSDLPTDYLLWIIKQDFDEDVMFTAKTMLANRR